MPVALRQRLNCHYCGRRSKHIAGRKTEVKFQCEHCLAVNYFDENGEVADVPLEEAAPAQRYAQPVRPDPLADDFSSQDSIFCSTCLKNQQIYTHTLAHCLPDSDHPDYERLEAELPEYKKKLEQRYPQCCARCEPRVRAQMERATYNARTDHLRRVLERSRQRRIGSRWGWRSLLVNAAGLGYCASLAVQVLWHLYGSQITQTSYVEVRKLSDCLQSRIFSSHCLAASEPLVGLSLVLGLLCIWWNPKWQYKLLNSEARLVRLHEYYMAQFILLGIRFTAWTVMLHLPISTRTKAMLHASFAVFLSILSGWSVFSIIKVRIAPPINWHQNPAPLLTQNQFLPPTNSDIIETREPQEPLFSASTLGPSIKPRYEAWNPPTPPADAADIMDWAPSQPVFQPKPKQIRYTALDPTPFHGTLQALNPRGVHRNANQANPGRQAIGLPPGFFDKPTTTGLPDRPVTDAAEAMAQPRFFGHNRESDTGLEDIFDSVFSIRDRSSGEDPPVAPTTRARSRSRQRDQRDAAIVTMGSPSAYETMSSIIAIFCITTSLALWILEVVVAPNTFQLGHYFVLSSVMIPVTHIARSLFRKVQNPTSLMFLYVLEAGGLLMLAMVQEPFGSLYRDLWDKLAIAAVALLLPQEFLALSRSYSTSTPTPQYSALSARESRESTGRNARARTMAETSREIMPGLVRVDSEESITPTSAAARLDPWETPQRNNKRFDYVEAMGSREPVRQNPNTTSTAQAPRTSKWNSSSSSPGGARQSGRGMFQVGNLGMHDNDTGVSRNENDGISDSFTRGLRLSSSTPGARRRL